MAHKKMAHKKMFLEAPQSALVDAYKATAWPKDNPQPEHGFLKLSLIHI